jgi:23S rRNA pseudouridine955/2504/2580 synthase/23S rRNA pseudouridine1911/1915/1917 synthase
VVNAVKLSSPETSEFWEVPVLFQDEHLLALNKPAGLMLSPDQHNPERPSLTHLLHRSIERGAPWAKQLGLDYLMNAHRVDTEVSGILLFARSKSTLASLSTQLGTDQPCRFYAALVRGAIAENEFETDAKLAPHPLQMDVVRVDPKEGKRSHTAFTVKERFGKYNLLECRPSPDRAHQVQAHLKHLRLPLVGDGMYGGRPLLLSTLKQGYRLKKDQEERPLLDRPALHLERMTISHPVTGEKITLTAPLAKDLAVSLKYLRRYPGGPSEAFEVSPV